MSTATLIATSLVCLGLVGAIVAIMYGRWLRAEQARVEAGSQLANTARGPVEYASLGDGPVILISHGGGGGYDNGLLHLRALAGFGFRVIAVSRAGYLRTPASVGRTPEVMADAYAALLDSLNISRAAIIGLSAGGPSAIQFALRHPERCWALGLISAITRQFLNVGRKQFLKRLGLADVAMWLMTLFPPLRQRYTRFVVAQVIPDPADRAALLADPEKLVRVARVEHVGGTNHLRQVGIAIDQAQWPRIPVYPVDQITAPILLLHGEADQTVPLAHAKFVAQTAPHAKLVTLSGAGHALLLTYPPALQQLVDFLSANAPSS